MAIFLTGLTLAYAIILALVLAASLITIAVTLWSIGGSLKQIAQGVKLVEEQTAPLGQHLTALNDGLGAISGRLRSAVHHLAATDTQLAAIMGEPVEPPDAARTA